MDPLHGESYLSLATFRKDGRAVETPVWFGAAQGKLWVFTAANAGKVKRLRNSSRARVAACDLRGKLRGEWIDATAVIVDDAAREKVAYGALREKYGWQMWLTDLASTLTGRIRHRKILEIETTVQS